MPVKKFVVWCVAVVVLGMIGCQDSRVEPSVSNLKLPALFSDHMILQQGIHCPVWGWAEDGAKVTVEMAGHKVSAKARHGRWQVELPVIKAGGPYTMTVSTQDQTIELTDVLAGEVWICSGQSNMEWPLESVNNAEAELASAQHADIRLFTVTPNTATEPLEDVTGQWEVCTPETVREFSAVGYLFGRHLLESGVGPIGLIDSTWGGTVAEAWTSMKALKQEPDFAPILTRDADLEVIQARLMEKYGEDLITDERNSTVTLNDNTALNQGWAKTEVDPSEWETMELPTLWEDAGLSIDGVVWFRKEVTIPDDWAGQDLTLKLATIDDVDFTYFNGEEIAHTLYDVSGPWMTPRVYDVPGDLVKAGKNVIAVRVYDGQGGGGIFPSDNPMQIGPRGDANPLDLSGTWQYRVECIMSLGSGQENYPARLYNAMISPLVPYGIKGAIWYQGESNADRAFQYRTLFPAMIQDWRNAWDQGDFPFYFVQLANYMQRKDEPSDSQWAELREAQAMTLSLRNTGMAVIIDVGNAGDIHPRDKQTVGKRLAVIAQAHDYDQDVVYSGPMYTGMTVQGHEIRLQFDHTDGGLIAKDSPLTGFTVAGEDQTFHWAEARIDGDTVVVTSDQVAKPVAVRYAWADNPACNLYNGAGLPASPFRTDDWPGITVENQ